MHFLKTQNLFDPSYNFTKKCENVNIIQSNKYCQTEIYKNHEFEPKK